MRNISVDSKMQGQKMGSSEDDDVSKSSKENKPNDDKKLSALITKKESKKVKNKKSEKKNSSLEREGKKFEGEGIIFKAKLIGLEDVDEARGDQLCQESLHRLKAAVKSTGTHKTRVTLTVSLEGIKIKDDKTGDILYHHPVHKISFISQDISDSRAFGYIFSLSQTGHQFVGIKTEKMAAHVVIALRDLFQTVLELKKQEIVKAETQQQQDAEHCGTEEVDHGPNENFGEPIYSEVIDRIESVTDLLDLRTELDQLQKGIAQMNHSIATSAVQIQLPMLIPQKIDVQEETLTLSEKSVESVIVEEGEEHEDKYAVFAQIDTVPSVFDNPAIVPQVQLPTAGHEILKADPFDLPSEVPETSSSPKTMNFSIFEELDPLGKGRPYVSKEDFFRDIKTPPKKTLKDFSGGSDSLDDASEPATVIPSVSLFDGEVRAHLPTNPFGSPPRIPPRTPPIADAKAIVFAQDPFYEKAPSFPPPPLVSRSSEPNFPVIPSPPPRPSPRKCATPSPLRHGPVRLLPASPLSFRKLPADEPASATMTENHFTFDKNDLFSSDNGISSSAPFSTTEFSPNPFVSPFSPKRNTPVYSGVVLDSVSVNVLSSVSFAQRAPNGTSSPVEKSGSLTTSPEERSIFRKTQDPFADDFFLSLEKSSKSSGADLCKNNQEEVKDENICEPT